MIALLLSVAVFGLAGPVAFNVAAAHIGVVIAPYARERRLARLLEQFGLTMNHIRRI